MILLLSDIQEWLLSDIQKLLSAQKFTFTSYAIPILEINKLLFITEFCHAKLFHYFTCQNYFSWWFIYSAYDIHTSYCHSLMKFQFGQTYYEHTNACAHLCAYWHIHTQDTCTGVCTHIYSYLHISILYLWHDAKWVQKSTH